MNLPDTIQPITPTNWGVAKTWEQRQEGKQRSVGLFFIFPEVRVNMRRAGKTVVTPGERSKSRAPKTGVASRTIWLGPRSKQYLLRKTGKRVRRKGPETTLRQPWGFEGQGMGASRC